MPYLALTTKTSSRTSPLVIDASSHKPSTVQMEKEQISKAIENLKFSLRYLIPIMLFSHTELDQVARQAVKLKDIERDLSQ